MRALCIDIKGNWAQFRKSETNNNPLSHDLITKTALIGMIGAVLGKSRTEMKGLFPILCEDLKYGVIVKKEVRKQSWGFTLRSVNSAWEKAPKQMEFLRHPHFGVLIALINNRSESLFQEFVNSCKEGKACYEPVLGLHNCPAEINFVSEGIVEMVNEGSFKTKAFVTSQHKMENIASFDSRLGFDKIPTYQDNDFWNLPEKYVSIVYPSGDKSIDVKGEYYLFNKEISWCLI